MSHVFEICYKDQSWLPPSECKLYTLFLTKGWQPDSQNKGLQPISYKVCQYHPYAVALHVCV